MLKYPVFLLRWGSLHILSRWSPKIHQHKRKFQEPVSSTFHTTCLHHRHCICKCLKTGDMMWKTARPICGRQPPSINESGAAVSTTPDWLQRTETTPLITFFVFIIILLLTKSPIKLQLHAFKQPKLSTLLLYTCSEQTSNAPFNPISVSLFDSTIHFRFKMFMVIWAVGCGTRKRVSGLRESREIKALIIGFAVSLDWQRKPRAPVTFFLLHLRP